MQWFAQAYLFKCFYKSWKYIIKPGHRGGHLVLKSITMCMQKSKEQDAMQGWPAGADSDCSLACYNFINLELGHDFGLQMILTKLTQWSTEIKKGMQSLRNK